MTNSIRPGVAGEPAWRMAKPLPEERGPAELRGSVLKLGQGDVRWLEMEWSEGVVGKAGRPVCEVMWTGVRAFIVLQRRLS
jgi:hypothetical protein